jgi:hypothetical protein
MRSKGRGKGSRNNHEMANEQNDPVATEPGPPPLMDGGISASDDAASPARKPAWAKDLRTLYNAVVEEPLPDSFLDLIARFDDDADDTGGNSAPEGDGPA